MTRDEVLVLTELNRLCAEAPAFALGFPDGNLPLADEYAVGFRLLDMAHGVLRHARERAELDGIAVERLDDTDDLKRQIEGRHEHDEPVCPEG